MKFEVQNQEQQMPIYWEQSASRLRAKDSNMEVEDEDYEIQKSQIWNNEDEEQMKDPTVNILLILELRMTNESINNNCRSDKFGMQI